MNEYIIWQSNGIEHITPRTTLRGAKIRATRNIEYDSTTLHFNNELIIYIFDKKTGNCICMKSDTDNKWIDADYGDLPAWNYNSYEMRGYYEHTM